jgi:hypothetical protein
MNFVVWWQPCDGQLSIYMCVMDDCRISNVLIHLICLCLSLLVMMNVFFVWPCIASSFYFEILAIIFTCCVK